METAHQLAEDREFCTKFWEAILWSEERAFALILEKAQEIEHQKREQIRLQHFRKT